MAKTTKTSGYDVTIKAFVPADLSDMEQLAAVQNARMAAMKLLADVGGKIDPTIPSITPTRR